MEEDKGQMTQDECKVTYIGKERQEQEKDMENMEEAKAEENMEESKEERTHTEEDHMSEAKEAQGRRQAKTERRIHWKLLCACGEERQSSRSCPKEAQKGGGEKGKGEGFQG